MRVEALDQKGANNKNTCSLCFSKFALKFHLFTGNRHNAPEGRKFIALDAKSGTQLLMDQAAGDDETIDLLRK